MKTIQEYVESGLTVTNAFGEVRGSYFTGKTGRIIFPRGLYASIVSPSDKSAKFSVAVADYEGYFDWDILKPYGATDNGTILCNTEEEVCKALEIISSL
jgi:hypothetical protein